ncbi:unnamed protein product, partial [Adineta ricciae]
MATTKRKYSIVAQSELDYENPLLNGKKIHKSNGKNKFKLDLLSRWSGDVSNTNQYPPSKNKIKTKSQPTLSELPDEILLLILSYLNKASLVAFSQTCRRHQAVGRHPSLWRRIDMSYKRVDCEQLNRLLQCGTTTLKMYQTTISNLKLISIEPSFLRHLDLSSTVASNEFLVNILHSCRSLCKLSLESLQLTPKLIEKIVLNEQLETLNLAMCTGLTLESIQSITNKLTLLRCLNVAWTNLTAATVQYLCENIPRCIEQLNISGQRHNLTDDFIQSLTRRALRLRVLDISDSILLTDQSIISLRLHSRLLTHLSASRCYLLTAPGLITLKLIPTFSTLDIFGTLAPGPLQQLLQECSTRIHLNKCLFSNIARPTTGAHRTA